MNQKQLQQIWDKTQGHCHFCGDPVVFEWRGWVDDDLTGYWEVDHVIQRGKGGSVSADNCLPACTRCNRLRWHRTGEAVRELLLLGIIAKDEVRKSTSTGKAIEELRARRLSENVRRRKPRRVAQLEPEEQTESRPDPDQDTLPFVS